jgi:hypothetical protein
MNPNSKKPNSNTLFTLTVAATLPLSFTPAVQHENIPVNFHLANPGQMAILETGMISVSSQRYNDLQSKEQRLLLLEEENATLQAQLNALQSNPIDWAEVDDFVRQSMTNLKAVGPAIPIDRVTTPYQHHLVDDFEE